MKNCQTHSGLTQHFHAKHREYRAGTPPSPAAVNDSDDSGLLPSINDSASDLPVDARDSFGSEHDSIGFDFENPLFPSLRPDSPVQENEASDSDSSTFSTEYHPLINGQ